MPDLQVEGQTLVKVPLADVRVWTPGRDYKGDEEVWSGNVYAKKAREGDRTITGYSSRTKSVPSSFGSGY